ncbi:MAG: GTP cyclohydrolase I FolE [Desulfovibrionaceae bacterium]|nr:GTP cyclohydrolase I FolE [Desulfovibrionaceae bacterium]
MDKARIEHAVREILSAIGENPDREGLMETPRRVADMFEEIFEGIGYTNDQIAEKFGRCFTESGSGDMVCVSGIECFSWCEHHLALMYNMKISVAYIPQGRVIGLSKISRIADMVCRRLQLQERIGTDIASIMKKITGSEDVAVYIEGTHACVASRGIRKQNAITRTLASYGVFRTDSVARDNFFRMAGGRSAETSGSGD